MREFLEAFFRVFNRQTLLFKVGTIALVLALVTGGSIAYAQFTLDDVYRIAVDEKGKMRLLDPSLKGKDSNELKKKEFLIELPSNLRVSELLNALEERLDALGENNSNSTAVVNVLESTVGEFGGKITGLEELVGEFGQDIVGLEGLVGELQETITGFESTISNIESLQLLVEELGGSFTGLENTLVNQDTDIGGLSELINQLGESIVVLDSVLNGQTGSISEVEGLIGTIGANVEVLEVFIAEYGGDITGLEGVIGELGDTVTSIESVITVFGGKVTSLESRDIELSANITDIQLLVEELGGSFTGLENTLVNQDTDIGGLSELVNQLGESIVVLDSVLSGQTGSISEVEGLIGTIGANVEALEVFIAEYGGDITGLEGVIGELGDTVTSIESVITVFGGKVTSLENRDIELSANITGLQGEVSELESNLLAQISDLQDQIDTLEQQMNSTSNGTSTNNSIDTDYLPLEGLVFAERAFTGDVTPTTFEDMSKEGHTVTDTSVTYIQLPSGLYVPTFNGTTSNIATGNDIFYQATFVGGSTYAAWVKVDTLDDTNQQIIDTEGRLGLLIIATTDLLAFNIYDGGGERAYGNSAITTDIWYFVVGTWDATTMQIYQDGVVQTDTEAATVPLLDSVNRPTAIGSQWDGDILLDGGISLVRVWNRALSAEEIAGIYEAERHWFEP
ncbi:LamG-like jellyroll fold domain-containing protein [Chloroflexota bacterium]